MSINVNVSGNPVTIKRGKYVGGEDYSSQEFDRRRKLRLQQVRQQSKDIAEDIRKRVRKEREKQQTEFEKSSERELKKWQTKKLLALQQQYKECVEEIGSGHTRAMLEPNADELAAKQRKQNEEIAQERGLIAEQEQQIKKNEESYNKARPVQQKKFTRVVEDTRSKLVTGIGKSKSEKTSTKKDEKYTTNIDISRVVNVSVTSSSPDLANVSSESIEEERSPKKKVCRERNVAEVKKPLRTHNESVSSNESPRDSAQLFRFPMETRISERIRNREKAPDPIFPLHSDESKEFPSKVDVGIDVPSFTNHAPSYSRFPPQKSAGSQTCFVDKKKVVEVPAKPTVSLTGLRASAQASKRTSRTAAQDFGSQFTAASGSKVLHYDHTNRFTKYEDCEQPTVEKIDDESLVFLERTEKRDALARKNLMAQRDKEAIVRGQRALEKDKVHRDYRNMLNNLAVLQKQERVASIAERPQRYHMSDERLREKYDQRQNRMENAYERTVEQKRRVITLKPINEEPPPRAGGPAYEVKSVDTNPRGTNWNFDFTNGSQEEQLLREDARTKSLMDMLERVNMQRKLLEREMSSLPKDGNLCKLVDEAKHARDDETTKKTKKSCGDAKCKRKMSSSSSELDSTANSDATKEEKSCKKTCEKESKKHKKSKKVCRCGIKTEATQTSPLAVPRKCNKEVQSSLVREERNTEEAATVKVSAVSCPAATETSSEENLCEIVIKIKDQGSSEGTKIVVNPGADLKDLKKDDFIKIRSSKITVQDKEKCSVPDATKQKKKSTSDAAKEKPRKSCGTSVTWKEQLSKSKNSTELSNGSSTSYYSPPDLAALRKDNRQTSAGTNESETRKARNALRSLLKDQPQQSNVQDSTVDSSIQDRTRTRAKLRSYVKALLSMSRGSVDNLGVSTGSEVSTPGQSVMGTDANNPLLPNILRMLNIDRSDLQYLLNVSSTATSSISVENLTLSSSSSCSVKRVAKSSTPHEVPKDDEENQPSTSTMNYPVLVSQYTQLADQCSQRISNLTSMIEKVRQEKMKLLQTSSSSSASERDNSTKYYDLPARIEGEEKLNANNGTISDEEFLNKYFLEIDMSFADKLKLESNLANFHGRLPAGKGDDRKEGQESFIPFLKDIPKPASVSTGEENANAATFANLFPPNFFPVRSKPPAAIINSTRKHNVPVDVVHELSTIPEMDTMITSRNTSLRNDESRPITPIEEAKNRNKSPKKNAQTHTSSDKGYSLRKSERRGNMEDVLRTSPRDVADGRKSDPKAKSPKVKSGSVVKRTVQEDSSGGSSGKDKSQDDEMEAMLKSMRMGWAIATLRKTHEALALTSSSSSSLDLSVKQMSVKISEGSSSSSDRSFRDNVLYKQLLEKFSTDGSVNASLLLKELSNLSGMQSSGLGEDKTQQRTSTPIQATSQSGPSADSQNPMAPFPVDSDISSVKHTSDDLLFLTLPLESDKSDKSDK